MGLPKALIGILTAMSVGIDEDWIDTLLVAALLWVGALNAIFGTIDIYDDTISRTVERSDAAQVCEAYVCRTSAHLYVSFENVYH